MSTGKVYLEWDLRFHGLDIYVDWESLSQLGNFISSGTQDSRAQILVSTRKVYLDWEIFYLEWDLRFQGLDDFMLTGKVYLEWEYLCEKDRF